MKEFPSLKELMQSTMDLKVHTSEYQLVIGLDFVALSAELHTPLRRVVNQMSFLS
jgi:hypothetical protein